MTPSRAPRRVLVTGGPTRAYLDRVRYLTNFSTGSVAYAVCRAILARGGEVALVAGPTSQPFADLPLAHYLPVETTEQMHAGVMRLCRRFRPDYAVFSAAVLDFAPARRLEGKVSSKNRTWTLRLKPTPKIIDEVGRRFPSIGRIGFKLEWAKGRGRADERFAAATLRAKGLQGLCLNYLSEIQGAKRGVHPAILVACDGTLARARSKEEIAEWIADRVLALLG